MEYIIERLNKISLPLSIITEEQSRRIISATVRKIGSLFDHYLVRVYRVEVTEDGNILDLVSSLGTSHSVSNAYSRIALDQTNRKGALSWCVEHKTSFWVENIIDSIEKSTLINKVNCQAPPVHKLAY